MGNSPESAISTTTARRKCAAACFLLCIVAIPISGALLWGRARRDAQPARRHQRPYLTSQNRSLRLLRLEKPERKDLLKIFWHHLNARATTGTDQPLPAKDLSPKLSVQFDATVFATLYGRGRKSIRRRARTGSLGDAMRALAQKIRGTDAYNKRGYPEEKHPRVRIDILTHSSPLSALRRHQFAGLGFGRPRGTAAWKDERTEVFLPSDFAGTRALSTRDILESPVRELGLSPDSWKRKDLQMSLLQSYSLVSEWDNRHEAVKLIRGLPRRRNVFRPGMNRSARMVARFIVRMQERDGDFKEFYSASTNMSAPNKSVAAQARSTVRLMQHLLRTGQSRKKKYHTFCRRSLADLLEHIKTVPDVPSVAFVDAPGSPETPSLLDTAWVLHAFSVYQEMTSDTTWQDLIHRLSQFLLLTQNDDGAFVSSPWDSGEEKGNTQHQPLSPEAPHRRQSVCSSALAAAYGQKQDPAMLRGAQKGLEQMRNHIQNAEEPTLRQYQGFIQTVLDLSDYLPTARYVPLVRQSVQTVLETQLQESSTTSPDIAGGIIQHHPPRALDSSRALSTYAAAYLLLKRHRSNDNAFLAGRIQRAARASAQFLLQFQFTKTNSYYILMPSQTLGGIRLRPGSNLATLEDACAVLRALDLSARATNLIPDEDDTQSKNK